MKKDEFGDRMKLYEGFETLRVLMPRCPAVARMDGIGFHNFTKGLKRPYDERLSMLMIEVAEYLLDHFGADAAYTQSDEITLGWNREDYTEQMFARGKIQKLNSHLAAKTTAKFTKLLPKFIPEKADEMPTFDARIFSLPNLEEAANQFLWREQDAAKNSISMAAREYLGPEVIKNKSGKQMQEMLFQQHGINWNNYPNFFKRGTFILRRNVSTPFTEEELNSLPEKHLARKNPNLVFERNRIVRFNKLPKFSTIANRIEFLFEGEEPTQVVLS